MLTGFGCPNIQSGTIYIGDIGKAKGTLDVTGAIINAKAQNIRNTISEIEITITESDNIPLIFFSVTNIYDKVDQPEISIVILKNQTATNVKIQIEKSTANVTDITLNVLIVKRDLL